MKRGVLGIIIVLTALAAVSGVEALSSCTSLGISDVLTTNVSASGNCITLTANNIELNCQGYTITFGTGGGSSAGIIADSRNNVTIRNCNIRSGNSAGSNIVGITGASGNNVRIFNSNITIIGTTDADGVRTGDNWSINGSLILGLGTSYGKAVDATGGVRLNLTYNTLLSNVTGSTRGALYLFDSPDSYIFNNSIASINGGGIYITSDSSRSNISNNAIGGTAHNTINIASSSSSNITIYNNTIVQSGSSVIGILTLGSGHLINYNNIYSNVTSPGSGLSVQSTNSRYENNRILNNGTSITTFAIRASAANNNFTNNNLTCPSSAGSCIGTEANNNRFNNTIIHTWGTSNTGINLGIFGSAASQFFNTFINNSDLTAKWISSNSGSNSNFTNTSFYTLNGTLNYPNQITISGSQDINRIKINISSNRVFVNSTNLTFLNTSAQITQTGAVSSALLVDENDDGQFSVCNPPRCVRQSFSSGTLIFNVSSFTTYGPASFGGVNITLSKGDSPDPINVSSTTILTYQINFTITNGTAFNTTINETYPSGTTFINATPTPTTGNTSWNAGNLTSGETYQINITVNVSNSLPNGTILTNIVNVTFENSTGSSFLVNVTENTTVVSAAAAACPGTIAVDTTLSSDVSSAGNCVTFNADNIFLDCLGNTIFFDNSGSGEAYGINVSGYNNVTVRNCRVFDNTTAGDNNRGISFASSSAFNISNVTVFTSTGTSGTAYSLYLNNAHNGSITSSLAGLNSTSATPNGFTLQVVNSRNNTISGNTLYMNVSSIATNSFVVDFITSANYNIFENNTVASNASATHNAVSLQSANITVRYNNISVFTRDVVTGAGISISQHNQTIYGNRISVDTSSTPTSYGINVGTSNDSVLYDNFINISGAFSTGAGVNLVSNSRQTVISRNNITVVCLSATACSAIDVGNSINSTIQHNILNATGSNIFTIDVNSANFAIVNNNTIFGNSTSANGQGIRYLVSSFTEGVKIINNNVTLFSNDTLPFGIRLNAGGSSHDAYLANNTVNVTGTVSTARGFSFENVQNVSVYNSTVYVRGISSVIGIYTDSTASNITINLAYVENNATDASSYTIADNDNATWQNITLFKRNQQAPWLLRASSSGLSNLSSVTFANENGSVRLNNFLANYTLTNAALNVTYNLTRVNSSNSYLNTTGQITLHNVSTAAMAVDFDGDGTFADCSSPQCVLESFNGSTIVFNVSGFTSYSAMNLSTGVSCGANLTSSTTLAENLTCPGTALILGANNVELNCNGYSISYGSNGSDLQSGVNASGVSNVNISNCIIYDLNASGSDGYGIWFAAVNNSVINNNTITTNGTSGNYGIRVNGSVNNINLTVTNNRISAFGSSSNNLGVYVGRGQFLNISQNNISTNGTSINNGIGLETTITNATVNDNIIIANNSAYSGSNIGISISAASNSTIYRNNVTVTGMGIFLDGANTAFIENNSITAKTITFAFDGVGIQTSTGTILRGNNINATGTGISYSGLGGFGNNLADSNVINASSGVLYTATQPDSNLTNNNMTVSNGHGISINSNSPTIYLDNNILIMTPPVGGPYYGIDIGTTNNSIINNLNLTVLGDTAWMRTTAVGRTANFTNTTFRNTSGSVFFNGTFQLENQSAVERSSLNISNNFVRVNSSTVPFLNRSAQIILNDINTSILLVDLEDDGTYQVCGASRCQLQSFNGSTVVFNVSSFTSYSTSSGGVNVTLTKTDYPNPVPTGTYLNYTITFNVTGGTAFNITINETYPANVTFVNSTPSAATGNNSWNAGNITSGNAYQINITVLVDNLTGGSVLTNIVNVTYENSSGTQFLINVSENTTVSVPLDPPILANVTLYATTIQNTTDDNLTVAFNLTAPSTMNPAWNITDWRMNDSSIVFFQYPFETFVNDTTTSLRDYSTSNISATLGFGSSSAVPNWTTSGQVGAAFDFDGTDDQINITDTRNPTQYSIEVWVKPDANTSRNIFVRTASNPLTTWSHQLRISSGSVFEHMAFDGSTVLVTGTTGVVPGTWYHVVGTALNGGSLALYVNGIQEGSNASLGTLWTAGSQYRIGSNSGDAMSFFDGIIDEVRLYNRSLSQAEIALLYNEGLAGRQPTKLHSSETEVGEVWSVSVTPNNHDYEGNTTLTNNLTIRTTQAPVVSNVTLNASTVQNTTDDNLTAYFTVTDADGDATTNVTDWRVNSSSIALLNYAFEAGSSNSTFSRDYSSNQNNGTVGGATFDSSGGINGFGAYQFDGSGDSINSSAVNLTDKSFSIVTWVKRNQNGVEQFIAGSGTASTRTGLHIGYRASNVFTFAFYGDDLDTASSYTDAGTWIQWTATYEATTRAKRIYRNGTLVASGTAGGNLSANSNFTIGGTFLGASSYFNGTIDGIGLYNRSLSAGEVLALFNNQTNLIVSDETAVGDVWQACVTPNDKTQDGNTSCSNNLTILAQSGVCPGTITSNTNLTEDINASTSGACVSFGADNIVLDCQGYTMTGNGSGLGINASSRSNIEIRNCDVARFNRNIYFTSTSNSRILSSNVTNSTDINIVFDTTGSANNLSNLVVVHNATGSTDAIRFFIAGTNQLRNISMSLLGTGSGAGVYFFGSSDNSLDNMTSYSEGSSHRHVLITSTAPRNNVTNIVASNGTMLSVSTASTNIIFINATGTNATADLGTNNNFVNNITANGAIASARFTVTGTGTNVSNINISNSGGTAVSIGSSTTRLINATANGTIGLSVTGSNNYFENIVANGTTGGGYVISGGAASNNVTNMNATGTSGAGILVSNSGSDNNRFINVIGTSTSGNGITFNTINNTLINSTGISSTGAGISLFAGFGSTAHTLQNVTGISNDLYGIEFSGGSRTTVSGGTFISNSSSTSEAIRISSSANNSLNNIIIESNRTWIFNNGAGNNITNSTFRTSQGNINILANATLGSETINVTKLNITSNRAFLNSTNLSFLNTTAQITLNNVASSTLLVDFEDDGTYALCNSPQCVLQSFASGTVIFNVSSFTSYSTSSFGGVNVTLSKSGSPDPLNISNTTLLTYQINFTVTNGTAFNITINETYPSNTTFINSTPTPTTGNNSWNAGNITATNTYQINITVNVSSSLANGTILTNIVNATLANSTGSQFLINVTENTTVLNIVGLACGDTVTTNTVLTQNYTCPGTAFILGANNVEFDCNGYTVVYSNNGSNSQYGIISYGKLNTTIKNCNLIKGSSSGSNGHGLILSLTNNSRIENNSINTNGTSFNTGAFINSSNNATITSNDINGRGSSGQNYGLYISAGSSHNVTNNRISSRGGSSSEGVQISSSYYNIFSYNNVSVNGTTDSRSYHGFSNNHNIIQNNIIIVNGSSTGSYAFAMRGSIMNNTILNNDVYIVAGTGGLLLLEDNGNNILMNNNFTSSSLQGVGITLLGSYSNNITNTRVNVSNVSGYEYLSNNSGAINSTDNRFTNLTFVRNNVTVNFVDFHTRIISLNASTANADPSGLVNISKYLNVSNVSASSWIALNISYTDADITSRNIVENTLRIWKYNQTAWINSSFYNQYGVDTSNNFVYANITNFSDFGILGETFSDVSASLTKTDSPDPLNISNTTILTYQINFTVTNGTAYNTTILETYSGNVTFVNSTPSPTSGNNNWSVGNLTTGQTYQINITVNVSNALTNGSIVTNTVNATYNNVTGSSFNINATAVTTILVDTAQPNATIITLTKTDSPDPLNISSTTLLTYQINFTVTNGTAYNTTINETYPSNTTFVNATPTPTTGNNSWNAGNITIGSTYQINITVNVSDTLSNGTILTNTVNTTYANSTGSTLTANVQENTTVIKNLEFNATAITLTKTDAPDPVVAGQDLTYTININVTNGTAYNITLTDVYPAQVSFVSATPANSTSDSWIVGNLTAGQNFQVNITVNVNSGTANGTVINNTANISYANSTGSILILNVTAQTTVSTQSFPIVINNNTNITTNGSTTGPGIIINASNVTVDCNNNIITGSGVSVGVNLTGFNNVTIQNCVFVNFETGAYVQSSDDNHFTNDVFRTVTNGVKLLSGSQNSVFNRTTLAASADWVFADGASSGNVFQNTSYNDTGGQIIITPAVTHSAGSNVSQSALDITSPDAFLNSSALPFLDVASRVTITGITNTVTALILGDFDDDGTYEICSAPFCSLIGFASGTAIFDTSGWTTYTIVDSGVNFTLSKTSSPNPVVPGNQVVFTITATVNSGFAQNITVIESPPSELTFVTSTPTNVSANTWLLNNLSAGQSAQINVTYAVNSSFTGTIQNNVSVTFQNSTNGTISTNVSENTTAQFPSPSGGSGGGGGGGSSAAICPPFCQYPENKDLPVCRNNCPPAEAPTQPDFGSMFPPVSEVVPPQIEQPVEEPVEEVPVVEETPVKELEPVKGKLFPWWYVLIAIVAIVFMIWETHHIVSKVHKPSKLNTKLEKVDKDIARMKRMLKKK